MPLKEETYKLIGQRYDYIKVKAKNKCQNRSMGNLDEDEKKQNIYNIEKLDELLNERGGIDGQEFEPEREIYAEEQKKIDEWGNEIKSQVNMKIVTIG